MYYIVLGYLSSHPRRGACLWFGTPVLVEPENLVPACWVCSFAVPITLPTPAQAIFCGQIFLPPQAMKSCVLPFWAVWAPMCEGVLVSAHGHGCELRAVCDFFSLAAAPETQSQQSESKKYRCDAKPGRDPNVAIRLSLKLWKLRLKVGRCFGAATLGLCKIICPGDFRPQKYPQGAPLAPPPSWFTPC